jgi:hypothetical protein
MRKIFFFFIIAEIYRYEKMVGEQRCVEISWEEGRWAIEMCTGGG